MANLAHELGEQLPAYTNAGCERVVYVCNLSQQMAESVAKMALETAKLDIEVIPIGEGLGDLIPVLEEIGRQLEIVRQRIFEQRVQKHAAAATQKGQSGNI